jgi:hypothetical protein
MDLQRTLYCDRDHRIGDGVPVGHACRVLDPAFLAAEREGDLALASILIEAMRIVLHPGAPVECAREPA